MTTAKVRARLSSPQLRQVIGNTGWLIGERIARGLIAITVTIAVARYLGPAQFGVLNYALSFVLLFATFWTLGLSGIVVRDLVHQPGRRDEILGTLFVLRLLGGGLGMIAILLTAAVVGVDDRVTQVSIAIISVATLFYAFDGIDFWLQSEIRSRYAVTARSIALIVTGALNVGLILAGAPLLAFVIAAALEYVGAGVALFAVYIILGHSPLSWRSSWGRAGYFLRQSWPLILSGALSSITLKIDQLLLGNLVGNDAVGTYAAAARLSEVWYFVPLAIASSFFPSLIRAQQTDDAAYRRRLQNLYDLMIWLSVPLALVVGMTSGLIVSWLYGPAYNEAAPILAIHIWAGPFVFMGAVLSKSLIAENRLKFSFVRHGLGAVVNVVLNLVLIPPLGGVGAAIATLIAYAVASFGACLLYKPTWPAARLMAFAIAAPVRLLFTVIARR